MNAPSAHTTQVPARVDERWARLFGATAAAPARQLDEAGAEGTQALQIAEAFVRLASGQRSQFDWITVACITRPGGDSRLQIVGPGALRGRSTPIPGGLLMHGIEITTIAPGETEAAVALAAVPRRPALARVLAAIESLGAAADPGAGAAGNAALHLAMLDRIELLAGAPGVQWRLAATIALGQPEVAATARHLLVLPRGSTASLPPLQVMDGRLLAGSTPETAQPWRERDYILLRAGPRPQHQGAVYDIDRLRRQHALVHSGTAVAEADAGSESFQQKSERLRLGNRLHARFGAAGMSRVPVVTPIAVEASANLAPLLQGSDGQLHPGFAGRINTMRGRLRERMGVSVPSLRLRINEGDLPPSSYIVMLDEIPLVMDSADPELALVELPVAALDIDGIDAEHRSHPAYGSQASVVRREHWAAARDKGFELLEADAVIVMHLEQVLMLNLVQFARLQDVDALFAAAPLEALRQRVQAAPGGMARLCGALHSLLSERVPIAALEAIVGRCLECWALPLHEIVEELRCLDAVRERLPGNTIDTPLLAIGPDIADALAGGISEAGDALILTLEPEITQELLAAVRTEVGDLLPPGEAAILVEAQRLRMPLRKLVELEFPNLMVLSRREALGPRSVFATITLD